MYTYNPNDVTLTVNDVTITGMGEDMITFEFEEDRFETVVGAQGDVVVNETNNKIATLTMTIQASSPQYRMCLDLARQGTEFKIWGVNKSIGERFGGTKARFTNPASVSYGTEIEDREFTATIFYATIEPC